MRMQGAPRGHQLRRADTGPSAAFVQSGLANWRRLIGGAASSRSNRGERRLRGADRSRNEVHAQARGIARCILFPIDGAAVS
jgi:hypothetical protein